jgi:peroxiredoxin Q/BCP
MNRRRALLLGCCLLACPLLSLGQTPADAPAVSPPATVGEVLPPLASFDEQGQVWTSADHAGDKVLVLYFYPGDFTGGCRKQAESFREMLASIEALGAEVVGVSGDDAPTHALFKETFGLKHTLLADTQGELAKSLGVPVSRGGKVRARDREGKTLLDKSGNSIVVERPATLGRWTFIVDRRGKIASVRQNVNPSTDAQEVLKLIESLAK